MGQAIVSALYQTYPNHEVIVVDDGSIDGTTGILYGYGLRDNRIRIHPQKNHGLVFSLNKGLKLAHGEYIACIDHDNNIRKPNRIIKQISVLESNDNVAVVSS